MKNDGTLSVNATEVFNDGEPFGYSEQKCLFFCPHTWLCYHKSDQVAVLWKIEGTLKIKYWSKFHKIACTLNEIPWFSSRDPIIVPLGPRNTTDMDLRVD